MPAVTSWSTVSPRAASPLVLTATFVVIRSERPRTNGIAFLSGFLLGTMIACGLGLVVSQAAVERLDSHDTVEGGTDAFFSALALLAVGLRARHTPRRDRRAEGSRASAILAGLGKRSAGRSVLDGWAARLRRAERLVLTLLAMASVREASLRDVDDLALVVVYIAVATALVSVPVGIVIVAGERAAVASLRAANPG